MAGRRRNTHSPANVMFLAAAGCILVTILIVPASAYAHPYLVVPSSDSHPGGEARLPVPVKLWQVPPVAVLLVFTAVFVPFCLAPAEILLSCAGFVVMNFRRTRKKTVLENDCRASIYRHIIANPGSGFTGIMNSLPVNRGTLHYHLGILCREKFIIAYSAGEMTRYFQNAGKFSDPEMDAMARLRNRVDLSICEFLSLSPGASRQEIAQRIQTTCSTVSWHMHRLCEAGVIASAREGRCITYRLTSVAAKVMDELQ